MFITKKRLNKLLCEAYEKGINNGYYLGWRMGKAEKENLALRDAEEILRKAREDGSR